MRRPASHDVGGGAVRGRMPSVIGRHVRHASAFALAALLAACAAPRLKPDAARLAVQQEREQVLAARDRWTIEGRLGVSDGRDGGSGSLRWVQDGAAFDLTVHAPVTGKTWVLRGDDRHAVLEGLRAEAVEGPDAAALLARELGWQVPVAELGYWIRGMRAPGPATLVFREDGLPARIEQAGWTVEYRDYDESVDPPLPQRIFASRGERDVRVSIRSWTLP